MFIERKKSKTTDITGGIYILAPDGLNGCAPILKLRDALSKQTQADVICNPEKNFMYAADKAIVLVGNLANSLCVKDLYYKSLSLTDLTYPGPGGYEIRTLLNPLATGHNIIQIGHSDERGLEKAVDAFISGIQSGFIRYFREINPTRFTCPQYILDSFKNLSIDDAGFYISNPSAIDNKAFLAYVTGDEEALSEYNRGFREVYLNNSTNTNHLFFYRRVFIWRLMEMTGMLDDDLGIASVNYVYEWARGRQGYECITYPIYQNPDYPRGNHGLIPAMGFLLLHDYFTKFYPETPELDSWISAVHNLYSVYNNGSWKPLCDGLGYGWVMSQPALVDYALFTDDHAYFESGGARKAADCAISVINNTYWLPNASDSEMHWYPINLLRACAAYYNDGRYKYTELNTPEYGKSVFNFFFYKTFDTGVEPVRPDDIIGEKVISMDPLVYHATDKNPELTVYKASDTAPNIPLEKCFDKLVIRTGLEKDDEFLLFDGLGGGNHAYADSMSILDYQRFGINFLVAEDSQSFPQPENHNLLTIFRNGKTAPIPAFAALNSMKKEDNGNIYVDLSLTGYDGANWRREVFFIPEYGFVLRDEVSITEDGDFEITSHLRSPGKSILCGDKIISKRQDKDGNTAVFGVCAKGSKGVSYGVKNIPLTIKYDSSVRSQTEKETLGGLDLVYLRYGIESKDIGLSDFYTQYVGDLKKGETVVFTTFAAADRINSDVDLIVKDGAFYAVKNGVSVKTPFTGYEAQVCKDDGSEVAGLPVIHSFDCDISFIGAQSGIYYIGMENGSFFSLDNGSLREIVKLGGKVTAAVFAHGSYFIAYGGDRLACVSSCGQINWDTAIIRIPSMYSNWEFTTPGAVTLMQFTYKGKPAIAAGCGDDRWRFYSLDGEMLDSFYYYAGVPDLLTRFDINGDGEEELLVTSTQLACISTICVMTSQGEELCIFGSEEWTSFTTAMQCFRIGGEAAVAQGVNHRNNFKVYKFNKLNDHKLEEHCYISAPLNGELIGIAVLEKAELIVGVTTRGVAAAYGYDGAEKWVRNTGKEFYGVISYGEGLLAWDSEGTLYKLSTDGGITGIIHTGREIKKVFAHFGSAALFTPNAVYSLQGI